MRILCYHSIEISQKGKFTVTGAVLRRQLNYCRQKKFGIISPLELLKKENLVKGRLMITFDDGYLDNYSVLLPLLNELNIPAIIFPVVGYIGQTNTWDLKGELRGRELLDWDKIREMSNQGIIFGSHGMAHVDLCKLNDHELEWELKESKRIMEEKLNNPVIAFSYPYGRYDERVKRFVKEAGYDYALALGAQGENNLNTADYFALKRVAIYGDELPLVSWTKINGLYDFLSLATGIYLKPKSCI